MLFGFSLPSLFLGRFDLLGVGIAAFIDGRAPSIKVALLRDAAFDAVALPDLILDAFKIGAPRVIGLVIISPRAKAVCLAGPILIGVPAIAAHGPIGDDDMQMQVLLILAAVAFVERVLGGKAFVGEFALDPGLGDLFCLGFGVLLIEGDNYMPAHPRTRMLFGLL